MAESARHLVYGLHAVHAMLERAPERVLELWLKEDRADRRARALRDLAQLAGVRIQAATPALLEKLAGEVSHQGAVAAVRPLPAWDEAQLLRHLDTLMHAPLLLVLDGITDPHNVGACLRSADAAGVDALIMPRDRSAGVDAVARKVAVGAAEFVPVVAVTNLVRTLEALKRHGVWIAGLAGEADKRVFDADFTGPLALVVGAEGPGMRRLTRECCDYLLAIPMAGHVASLNVSVSAGIALFEAVRQRTSHR